VVRVCLNSRV